MSAWRCKSAEIVRDIGRPSVSRMRGVGNTCVIGTITPLWRALNHYRYMLCIWRCVASPTRVFRLAGPTHLLHGYGLKRQQRPQGQANPLAVRIFLLMYARISYDLLPASLIAFSIAARTAFSSPGIKPIHNPRITPPLPSSTVAG